MSHNPNIDILNANSLYTMVVSFVSGIVLSFNETLLLGWDFPPVFLHSLQVLAWIIAIITGSITIYKHFKRRK